MGLQLPKRYGYICVALLVAILIVTHVTLNRPPRDPFIRIIDDDNLYENTILANSNLVNLTDFRYVLNSQLCANSENVLGVLIVTSYVGHDELRSAHRQAMPQTQLTGLGIVRVFLIAEIPSHEQYITQKSILNEHQRFGDLVQGNFIEAYRNLTYKHIMGLRWASQECKSTKYIVKADDDTVFDLYYLYNFLLDQSDMEAHQKNDFLAGFVLDAKKPIRNTANKWYVSETEFQHDVYPDYLSGWLYVTNVLTASRLVDQAQKMPFMWIDDTWVTGILRDPLAIPLVALNKWFSANSQFLDCCIEDIRRWSVRCDYHIGPNGGDTKLIVSFTKALDKCYNEASECVERGPTQSLATTCIGRLKNLVEDHGRPVIESVALK